MRVGFAKDVHKFTKKRPLILGGEKIAYKKGLFAYSDGDVVLHSLIDALCGALNIGDIGTIFPNTDPMFHNISSIKLLEEMQKKLENYKVFVEYIDIFISCEAPKLSTYVNKMKENISNILKIDMSRVSIKCGTNEKLGYIGKKKGIESFCIVALKEEKDYE